MGSLSVHRLDYEVVKRLKVRVAQGGVSPEETVRCILGTAVVNEEPVGTMIRRMVGNDGFDLELPEREADDPIDFTSPEYGEDDPQ